MTSIEGYRFSRLVDDRLCDICKTHPTHWESATGHAACEHCRLDNLHGVFNTIGDSLASIDDELARLRSRVAYYGEQLVGFTLRADDDQ